MTAVFERPIVWLLLLALVVWLSAAPAITQAVTVPPLHENHHAEEKHGTASATIALKCLEPGRLTYIFEHRINGRKAIVCFVDEDSKWAVNIFEKWGQDVTRFVKEKLTRFEQVEKYMNNALYEYKGMLVIQ